jgi:hypothetical protein
MPMPLEILSIAVSFSTMASVSLPFPNLDGQDVPLQTIGDAIGYIILWPWKLTTTYIRRYMTFTCILHGMYIYTSFQF